MPRARLAVDRALELDPLLGEGHLWRGVIALLYEYDPVEAEARVTRAIELQPSAVHARIWRSILRSLAGRHDEAIAEALEAERLTPSPYGCSSRWGGATITQAASTKPVAAFKPCLAWIPTVSRTPGWPGPAIGQDSLT